MPVLREETRGGHPSSHVPIRAERPTTDSHALPLSRDETIRPRNKARSRTLRQRPLNRETLSDRLAPPAPPQRTTDHPEQSVERSEQESQTGPEECDARVDDEPLHREVEEAGAGVTTTRKPMLRAHTTRVVERAQKRDMVTKTHFRSNFSNHMRWCVIGHTISYEVNAILLQYTPNLLDILHINAGDTDIALDLTITVLNNFDLKRDTVQTKNDLPAQ